MVAFTLLAGLVAITGGILSPAVVLDVVALWPLALPALAAGVAGFWIGRRNPRWWAAAPLLALSWLLVAVGLHLSEAAWLPSASADVAGPPAGDVSDARLEAQLDGRLVLMAGDGPEQLYALTALREGGDTGPPAVGASVGEGRADVLVAERDDSPWFRFSGWQLDLAPGVTWRLEIIAGEVSADLRRVAVSQADLSGGGQLRLDAPIVPGRIRLRGDWTVEVPEAVAIRVEGAADVPDDWVAAGGGRRSPVDGDGWVVELVEGSLAVGHP